MSAAAEMFVGKKFTRSFSQYVINNYYRFFFCWVNGVGCKAISKRFRLAYVSLLRHRDRGSPNR